MEIREGYKKTEIGVIPYDWECLQLGDIGESIIGLTYKPSDVKSYGKLVLRSSNIDESKLVFTDNVYVNMQINEKLIVQENDILVCVRNGSRNLIGKCAIIDKKTAGQTFGAFMSVFRSDYGKYVFHCFQSNIIKKQIKDNLGATINQITNKNLNSFYIPLPKSDTEQTTIATALSDIDGLISSLTKLVDKKKNNKQGAMQELLKPKERWVLKKLRGVLKIRHGKSQKKVVDSNGEYPILATGGVIGRANKYIYNKPSVLIGRKGTIDVPQYMDSPFWTIDTLFYTEVYEPNNAKYLFYQFCLIDWYDYNEASGVPSLNAHTIENIEIAIPEPHEQNRIANILSDMDTEIEILQNKLIKYKAIKQGMMQELLTGRIRLVEEVTQ